MHLQQKHAGTVPYILEKDYAILLYVVRLLLFLTWRKDDSGWQAEPITFIDPY